MSGLGENRSSGWSRRSLQRQVWSAARPQVRFEPSLTDSAASLNVGYTSWLLKTDFTKSMNFVSLCGLYRSR